ncbi:MAG: hypothetical protein H7X80_07985 [bacterium]|nr:hypothetical protein [Candidatus Kapabacteria bacterium]
MDKNPLSRRSFIGNAIGAGTAVLLVPEVLNAFTNDAACTPTSRDLYGLGPFHETNAPFRIALAAPTEPGRHIAISGLVTARDCTTPLPDVVVDVWGANDAGCYTQIDANGNLTDSCSPRSNDVYNLRGRLRTNADGIYSFKTVAPGSYLNGARYRPSHLHFIVTPPGGSGLITQLYFEGDQYIEGDLGASDPNAQARIIPLTTGDEGLSGRFDIILNVDGPASIASRIESIAHDALIVAGANPASDETRFDYVVAQHGRAGLVVFDALGERVRTLVDSVHASGHYEERWDLRDAAGSRVAAGTYICLLRTSASTHTITVVVQ